jgi:hypothetical protein
MTALRRILTATAFVTLASSAAMANVISFSHTTATTATPFSDTFTLSNFNTSLGTLTGVAVTLSYTTTGEVDVFNSTVSPQAFTNATSSVPLTLTAPAGLTSSANAVAGPINGVANPGFNAFTGIPGSGTLTVNVLPANFLSFEIPPAALTSSFTVAAGTGLFSGNSVQGVFFGGSATAGGTTTVTYTYTVPSSGAPEPATAALMGGALIGLGLLRKRPKRI